jgi:hypothetical protein
VTSSIIQQEKSLEEFDQNSSVLDESNDFIQESDDDFIEKFNEELDGEISKEAKKECKFAKRIIIDNDRSLVLDQHIVIPLDAFVAFIDRNFVCRNCGKSPSVFKYQRVGIACSINWFCVRKQGGAIKARLCQDNEEETKKWNESSFTRLKPASHFELNSQLVLGVQDMGCRERDASILAGMLDLSISPMQSAWSRIEQDIGVEEIKVGKQIIIENVKLEAELTGTEPFLQRQDGPPMPLKYLITSKNYTEKHCIVGSKKCLQAHPNGLQSHTKCTAIIILLPLP